MCVRKMKREINISLKKNKYKWREIKKEINILLKRNKDKWRDRMEKFYPFNNILIEI